MIFSLYTVYKKHDDDKNSRPNQRKSASITANAQIIVLSTVIKLTEMFCRYFSSESKTRNIIQLFVIFNDILFMSV